LSLALVSSSAEAFSFRVTCARGVSHCKLMTRLESGGSYVEKRHLVGSDEAKGLERAGSIAGPWEGSDNREVSLVWYFGSDKLRKRSS
jgi:hypothetical protein